MKRPSRLLKMGSEWGKKKPSRIFLTAEVFSGVLTDTQCKKVQQEAFKGNLIQLLNISTAECR